MLKKLAIIYAAIALISSLIKIYSGVIAQLWTNIYFWLSWPFNLLGIFAVFGFALKRTFLNSTYWKVILVGYISLRVYELLKNGLFIENVPLLQNIIIGLKYTLLVVPPLVAIWYLAYIFNNKQKLITRHSS